MKIVTEQEIRQQILEWRRKYPGETIGPITSWELKEGHARAKLEQFKQDINTDFLEDLAQSAREKVANPISYIIYFCVGTIALIFFAWLFD